MATRKTKFTVGLFVFLGLALAVWVTIWLGMSRYLEKGRYYVTYFDESVQGLGVDSPVKYRGVFIGRVKSIGVAPDSKLIKVVLNIESDQQLDPNIVAQLKSVGITGSMFVELDQKIAGEPDQSPALSFPSEYPIIASKPSEISGLYGGLNKVLEQIKLLDLESISNNIKMTLENINQTVDDANVERISKSIETSFKRMEKILADDRWDKILGSADSTLVRVESLVNSNEQKIAAAIDDFNRAMQHANALFNEGSALISGTDAYVSELMQHLLITARNLQQASDNLNRLMEILTDHPSQLVFGQPPVPRDIEAEAGNP
jgi:phospholipid/cholesterol/gamma-HCH transport system substrate-binding protein